MPKRRYERREPTMTGSSFVRCSRIRHRSRMKSCARSSSGAKARRSEGRKPACLSGPSTTAPTCSIKQAWRAYCHQSLLRPFPSRISANCLLPSDKRLSICTRNIPLSARMNWPPVVCLITWFMATSDTGGEVESLLGRLLHHVFKRRGARLFGCFSWQPAGEVNDIDRCGDSNMSQMCFG